MAEARMRPRRCADFSAMSSRSNRISISAFIGVYLRGLWAATRPWLSKSTDHGVMRHVRPDAGWWGRPVVGEVGITSAVSRCFCLSHYVSDI